MVWWKGNEITVGQMIVNFNKYKTFLQGALIFGSYSTMQELKDTFNISQLSDLPLSEDALGNRLLFDQCLHRKYGQSRVPSDSRKRIFVSNGKAWDA